MKFLITNDDGINGEGLLILVKAALKYGPVIVVAPKVEQSGKSHSLNLRVPLSLEKVNDIIAGVETYVLDSTPADCVRVANNYLHKDFDIVLSGVNEGYNIGDDVHYSGTIGAAIEGTIQKKKAIAISTDYYCLGGIKESLDEVLKFIFENRILDEWDLYNVNIPLNHKGIRFCSQGETHYTCEIVEHERGVIALGKPLSDTKNESSDIYNIYQKYITITPLLSNFTNFDVLKKLLK